MSELIFTFEDGSEYLCHYGVLGMKWGVRKKRPSISQKKRKQISAVRKQAGKQAMKVGATTGGAAVIIPLITAGLSGGTVAMLPAGIVLGGVLAIHEIIKQEQAAVDRIRKR